MKKVAPPRRIDPKDKESMNRLLKLSAPRVVDTKTTNHNKSKTIDHRRNNSSHSGQRYSSVQRN